MDRIFTYVYGLRPGDRMIFMVACTAFVIALLVGAVEINKRFLVDIPLRGSVFVEGFLGVPRFINPVLATTQTDKDLSGLVYAGLLRADVHGNLEPYLAESIEQSDDGRTYQVTLRQDGVWSDGSPITAEDVAFTYRAIQDPVIASPLRSLFDRVAIEVTGTHTLTLGLEEPNPMFMDTLTVGILPVHVWSGVSPDRFPYDTHNTMPVGAGPYVVERIIAGRDQDSSDTYVLAPNVHARSVPSLSFYATFYSTEEARVTALHSGEIDAAAGVDAAVAGDASVWSATHSVFTRTLPRTFGIFFNQNKSVALRDQAARDAIAVAIDRESLVAHILRGYGTATYDPIPESFAPTRRASHGDATTTRAERARARLEQGGWVFAPERRVWEKHIGGATTTLTLAISTLNTPVFADTAADIQQQLAALSVPVTIRTYDRADITNTIIPQRDYDAILYGTAVGRSLDIYPFWHSSRRADPGLNIAMYTNLATDAALAEMRSATTTDVRLAAYTKLADILRVDVPAVFLYSPANVYVVRNGITVTLPDRMIDQAERFAHVSAWYRETEAVWSIFTPRTITHK